MADVQPIFSYEDTLERIVDQSRADAREALNSVWEELASRVQRHFQAALEERARAGREQGAGRIRRQFASQLNQAVRRLRQFDDDSRWAATLLDTTAAMSDRAALFTVNSGVLHLSAVRGIAMPPDFGDLPLAEAPAFASVEQTRDTVVALRSQKELSSRFADLIGDAPDRRCWLFPVNTRERVAAVLYADAEDHIEIEALELMTRLAGLVLDTLRPQSQLISIAPPAPQPADAREPELSPADRALHVRAQRFARVRASRLLVERREAVEAGRSRRDLYSQLKTGIESARKTFRRDFVTPSSNMQDYLHQEFVRILANNDADLLGPGYPGPMV